MNIRIAAAIFVLLILSVAVGLSALPDNAHYPTPENAVHIQTARSAAPEPDIGHCALILGLLISGAATVGLAFFAPRTPKGSRTSGSSGGEVAVRVHHKELVNTPHAAAHGNTTDNQE
ncbi:hypothetical protein [Nocardia abscessus]|uniref:hypothetical protein n=1 Tax=Nocardia abscessus TaxID=120957 RepID=UPI002455FC8C|nr:hypothetical protein [Nocardia abscessus]